MPKDTVKTAYAYLRVGSRQQAVTGISIDVQKEAIKKYCRENNIRLVDVFADCPASANDLNRKDLVRMLGRNTIKPVDYIIVHGLDRLSRNLMHHAVLRQQLSKFGTEIRSLSQEAISFGVVEEMLGVINGLYPRIPRNKECSCGDPCDCECRNR